MRSDRSETVPVGHDLKLKQRLFEATNAVSVRIIDGSSTRRCMLLFVVYGLLTNTWDGVGERRWCYRRLWDLKGRLSGWNGK